MVVSRRRFLKILVGVVSIVIASFFVVKRLNPVRVLYNKLTSPDLKDTDRGSLNAQILQNLLAATEVITDMSIEKSHYEDFFRWRSENLKGYRSLYEQFAASLDKLAKETYACTFIDCEAAKRHDIVENIRPEGKLDKFRRGFFKKDWLLFEKYIIREILSLFARTDAWVLLGYEYWPGTPRGLEGYTKAPSKI